MDYKKDEKIKNIDENVKSDKSFIDYIVNTVNMLMDIGVILLSVLFYIYKFIVRHTFVISVIIVIFGYIYMIN